MFLKIENRVSSMPSIELIRMLGASASRGVDENIGQFGSGFPNSLALLARKGLLGSLKLCLGTDVYTFSVKDVTVKDGRGGEATQGEIYMKRQGGGSIGLNIAAGFGGLDWTDVTMAIREFVSNAIDGATGFDGTTASVAIEEVEDNQCRAKVGMIRIYVESTPEIREYVRHIARTFLQLGDDYDPARRVLPNDDGGPARVYRKGVLVGTFGKRSLFHYNIPDIELKESRNVDGYAAEMSAARAIAACRDAAIIREFIEARAEGREVWEARFAAWHLDVGHNYGISREEREEAKTTWKEAVATSALASGVLCDDAVSARIVASKGGRVIGGSGVSGDFGKMLREYGVKDAAAVLDYHELNGREIVHAGENVVNTLIDLWADLESIGMTFGKDLPDVRCFRQNTVEGGMLGYFVPDGITVYIREDISEDRGAQLHQTLLEECGHYITGASDYTRDFQEWAFKVATAAMRRGR